MRGEYRPGEWLPHCWTYCRQRHGIRWQASAKTHTHTHTHKLMKYAQTWIMFLSLSTSRLMSCYTEPIHFWQAAGVTYVQLLERGKNYGSYCVSDFIRHSFYQCPHTGDKQLFNLSHRCPGGWIHVNLQGLYKTQHKPGLDFKPAWSYPKQRSQLQAIMTISVLL